MLDQNTLVAESKAYEERLERERLHFNKLAQRSEHSELVMPADNVQRYDNPSANTPYPLEYAFHLLGNLRGKTIVDLGCGDGLNTTILALLGARVISVDISDKSLELTCNRVRANGVIQNVTLVHSDAAGIPLGDHFADGVLCAAILHHVDCLATARQIRRILKPGGVAVFSEPLAGPSFVGAIKTFLPKTDGVSDDEAPLTLAQVEGVSRAVGREGRRREFGFTMRLINRTGVGSPSLARKFHRFDAWVFEKLPVTRVLASPLVWEAYKES